MSVISFCTVGIIPPAITYLGLFVMDWGDLSCMYSYYPAFSIGVGISIFIVFFVQDWDKIDKLKVCNDDKVENQGNFKHSDAVELNEILIEKHNDK